MDAATAEFDATMAFATPDIAAGRIRPLFVLRHPKTGMWYLLPSIQVPTTAAEAMITLGEIARHDEALRQLAGLHAGQAARRSSPADPWRGVKLSQPVPAVAPAGSVASVKTTAKQLGAGHDPAVQRLERGRARFAGIATFWLTIPGLVIVLAGVLAFIGLDLGKQETLGFPTAQVVASGLLVCGTWFVAFGLASGAGVRSRWIMVGSLLPLVLGGLAGAWGLGWLGSEPPTGGPAWLGVSLWWVVTQPLAILLLLIAVLCWVAAIGTSVCDRRLRRVDAGG